VEVKKKVEIVDYLITQITQQKQQNVPCGFGFEKN
jgi:hypothetical protein